MMLSMTLTIQLMTLFWSLVMEQTVLVVVVKNISHRWGCNWLRMMYRFILGISGRKTR